MFKPEGLILNRLKTEFNWTAIDENFSIYRVPNELFQKIILNCNVKSSFASYVLLENKNLNNFIKFLSDNNTNLKKEDIRTLDVFLMVRLFLNALQESDGQGYHQANGRLFYTDLNSVKNSDTFDQVLAQEVMLDKDLTLWLRTITFTKYEKLSKKQQNKVAKSPAYTRNSSNVLCPYNMVRFLSSDGCKPTNTKGVMDELYYIIQPSDKPSKARNYFSVYSAKGKYMEAYMQCRVAILYQVVSIFNEYYDGFANLSFCDITEIPEFLNTINNEKGKRTSKNVYYANVLDLMNNFVNENEFNIIYDDAFNNQATLLSKIMNEIFSDIRISFNKSSKENMINLIILHEKDFYTKNKLEDPYKRLYADQFVKQVISAELIDKNLSRKEFIKGFIEKIVCECIIKKDLLENKVSFLNEEMINSLEAEEICFVSCKKYEIKDAETEEKIKLFKFYILTLNLVDKRTTYNVYEDANDIPFEIYETLIDLLDVDNLKGTEKYIVEDYSTAFAIEDTHMFSLPNHDDIIGEILISDLNNTKPKFRNKVNSHHITNMLDLKMFSSTDEYGNDIIWYFSGLLASELKAEKIDKAPLIRKVIGYAACNMFLKYRSMLEVNFITSNNRFTVYPFPFKYLNEYIDLVENNETR